MAMVSDKVTKHGTLTTWVAVNNAPRIGASPEESSDFGESLRRLDNRKLA